MASIWDMSTTPANNNAAVPNGAPEGWLPSNVNDWGRQLMADVIGANLIVTASGTDTYTATLNPAPTQVQDGMMIRVRFTNANTITNPTLNVNGLTSGAVIKRYGSQALIAGTIPAASDQDLSYVAGDNHWELQTGTPDPGTGGAIATLVANSPLTGGGTAATVSVGLGSASITNALLATMAPMTFKMNNTGSTGAPIDGTIAQATAALGLGTAAFLAVGTSPNQIPQLGGAGKLSTSLLDTGTSAGQVVKLDGSAALPAVSGANLTNLPSPSGGLTAGTTNTMSPVSAGASSSVAHGLGAAPAIVMAWLECTSAEINYSVGDRVYLGTDGNSAQIINIQADATNTNIIVTDSANPQVLNKTAAHRSSTAITLSKWKIVAVPYKIN